MGVPDFRTLIGHQTVPELVTWLAQKSVEAGSKVTNYNVGGVWRSFIETAAQGFNRFQTLLAGDPDADTLEGQIGIVHQGFPLYATGKWMDLHLEAVGTERKARTRTVGTLTVNVSSGTATIPEGWTVTTEPNIYGQVFRFRVTEGAEISAPSGTVTIEALTPGSAYNLAQNTITVVDTPVPNVSSVANAGADWITDAGTDVETDAEAHARYPLQWSGIAAGATAEAYEGWVLNADADVKAVTIRDDFPRGPGTVDALVVGPTGIPSASLLATVQASVEAHPLRPMTDNFLAVAPTAVPVDRTVAIQCWPNTPDTDAVEAHATEVWNAFFVANSALNGEGANGQIITDDDGPKVPLMRPGRDWLNDTAVAVLKAVPYVRKVTITPSDDITVEADALATLGTLSLSATTAAEG